MVKVVHSLEDVGSVVRCWQCGQGCAFTRRLWQCGQGCALTRRLELDSVVKATDVHSLARRLELDSVVKAACRCAFTS